MKPLHVLGLVLVGVGLLAIAMADDSGGFGAMIEISESEDGPVLKLAMKTNLASTTGDVHVANAALPYGSDI